MRPECDKLLQSEVTAAITHIDTRDIVPTYQAHPHSVYTLAASRARAEISVYLDGPHTPNTRDLLIYDLLTARLTQQLSYRRDYSANVTTTDTAATISRQLTVTLSVTDYCETCHVSSRHTARKQLCHAANVLYGMSLYCSTPHKRGKSRKTATRVHMRLISAVTTFRDSISLTWTPEYCTYLAHCRLLQLPRSLYTVDVWRDAACYYIGRKLVEHYNINARHSNRNSISLMSLLAACPAIRDSGRHTSRQIIRPLLAALSKLTERYNILESWQLYQRGSEIAANAVTASNWRGVIVRYGLKDTEASKRENTQQS